MQKAQKSRLFNCSTFSVQDSPAIDSLIVKLFINNILVYFITLQKYKKKIKNVDILIFEVGLEIIYEERILLRLVQI